MQAGVAVDLTCAAADVDVLSLLLLLLLRMSLWMFLLLLLVLSSSMLLLLLLLVTAIAWHTPPLCVSCAEGDVGKRPPPPKELTEEQKAEEEEKEAYKGLCRPSRLKFSIRPRLPKVTAWKPRAKLAFVVRCAAPRAANSAVSVR